MKKKRVALITESTARKEEPTPAFLFYRGSYNKWVNSIIKYLEEREFPKEDAFFVSYANFKIYGFEELVSWYDKTPDPNSKERRDFANIIMNFIEERYQSDEIIVELHLSKLKYDKLIDLLKERGYEFKVYAEVPLGEKPNYYERLIKEEKQYRKLRDLKREKYNIIRLIPNKTPEEAKQLFENFKHKAHLHGVDDIFEELKQVLKDYWQAKKATDQAKEEAIQFIENEDKNNELAHFLETKELLASLFQDIKLFETLNQKYGKAMAKIERYLVKAEYLIQKEFRIRSSLLKLQIVLMKG
ncbi:hypothetical protein [Viridibacillus arvi]|uniref:hypothetical protein n=1 Tax=Viridibacillus arvi TaxID=263475 RepID=UPI0034CF8B46